MPLIVQMNSHLLIKHSALKFWDGKAGAPVIGVTVITVTKITIIVQYRAFHFEVGGELISVL